MKQLLVIFFIFATTVAQADNRILWQEAGIESGGGGWWFNEHVIQKLDAMQQRGMPSNLAQRVLDEGVSGMKQATIAPDQRDYRWYWYGFRFSRSTAQGVYLAGPGVADWTFTDPEDPSNTYTVRDLGMYVSADNEMNTYYDTTRGACYVQPHKKDPRRMTKVWCLVRLPRSVGGRPLDRVCVLDKVQPVNGRWEVVK